MSEQYLNETWKPVVGYEGIYSVSSLGRVRLDEDRRCHKSGYITKFTRHAQGYVTVGLTRPGKRQKTFCVHWIVATVFLGERPAGLQVNHKNGMKDDNRVENLEYVTPKENRQHAANVLLSNVGSKNCWAKLTEEKILEIRQRFADGETQTLLGKEFGVSQHTIWSIVRGRTWKQLKPRSSNLLLS